MIYFKIVIYSFLFKIKNTIIFQGKNKLHTTNEFVGFIFLTTYLTENRHQSIKKKKKTKATGEIKEEKRMIEKKKQYVFHEIGKSFPSLHSYIERCLVENMWRMPKEEGLEQTAIWLIFSLYLLNDFIQATKI